MDSDLKKTEGTEQSNDVCTPRLAARVRLLGLVMDKITAADKHPRIFRRSPSGPIVRSAFR